MRDTVVGVVLGALAVVLASWYLTRTRGALLPSAGALGWSGSTVRTCPGAINQGYQATSVRAPSAPPVVYGAFQ